MTLKQLTQQVKDLFSLADEQVSVHLDELTIEIPKEKVT